MNGHRRHYVTRQTSDPDENPFSGTPDQWAPGARHGASTKRPGSFDLDAVLEEWARDATTVASGDRQAAADPVAAVAASANRALASIDDLRKELTVAGASAASSVNPVELRSVLRSARDFADRAAVTAEEEAHRALALGDEVERLREALELFTQRNEEVVRELRRLSHTLRAHTPAPGSDL